MPYFPLKIEGSAYKCPACGQWFWSGDATFSCCVLHEPGSCCHFGETKIEPPKGEGVV